jgi:hypothetical protein
MKQQIVFAIVRHLLTALGGVLVTRGTLDHAGLETVVGALMSILGVLWTVTHKVQNETIEPGQPQNWLGGPADTTDHGGAGNGGNFRNGLGLLLVGFVLCVSFVVCTAVRAEDSAQSPTSNVQSQQTATLGLGPRTLDPQNRFTAVLRLALDYVADNGELGTGYGVAMDGSQPGILLTQKLDVYKWQLRRSQIGLGLVHATLFTLDDGDSDLALLGLGASWHWFKSPPWVADLQALPVIRNLLLVEFSEFKLAPLIGIQAEDLVKGQFHWRRTYVGAGVSFKY